MKKFIATLAAAALAIAGAVVAAPSAQADFPLYPNCAPEDTYGDNGEWCYELKYGNQPTLIDRVSTEMPDYTPDYKAVCDPLLLGAMAERGLSLKDGAFLSVDFSGIYDGSPFSCFASARDVIVETVYRIKRDYGVQNIYVELVSGDFNIDECKEFGREYAEEKYGPLIPGYLMSGRPAPNECTVGFEVEPQTDADCADDEMVVPTTTHSKGPYNKCITIPTAVSAGKEDKQFDAMHYDGIVGDDWKMFEICSSVDYIGNWLKLQDEKSWTDWYRENMALGNLTGDDDLADCVDRSIDAVDGDQNFMGLSSFTSYTHMEDFFTVAIAPKERLCDVAPLQRNNRHDQHCQTTVQFAQVVTTWVDPNQYPPDPDFGVTPLPGEGPQVSVELPELPTSLDYEFVYEQGEAGVCLYDGEEEFTQNGLTFCGTPVDNPADVEPIQDWQPPPPECWQGPNNCPVGQSISYAVPKYMMVGVPVNVTVYATRTVEDELGRFNYGQPDNGTAVIHYGDHESDPPVAGVPFENGQATFRVVPQEAGKKNFSICGVLNSGTSGGNAYIECIDGETTVLPYDPEVYRKAFRDLALEKGDRFTIVDADQAKGKVAKRLEWRVAQSDEDVCAVYETKKGKIRAKFNKTGECTVLWEDPKTGESGRLQIGS
jgi:hypothetical protein